MIKANELRIGNKFTGIGRIETVASIESYGTQPGYEYLIRVENSRNQYKPVDMFPIPLTPEILEKFGFYLASGWGKFELIMSSVPSDKFKVFYHNEESGLVCCYRKDGSYCVRIYANTYPHILYLHQLQNLYFSLNYEELENKTLNQCLQKKI